MHPLVSILIPAFNSQQWIADTLRSAVAQTYPRKEIIVVDDGSTDGTSGIARRFESDLVRVISQPNQGAAAARNKAFSLCRGDYIQWLDADDLLAPDKIAQQMEAVRGCQGKGTLFSSAWGQFMYRYYRAEFIPTGLWCNLSPLEWLLRKMGQNLYMQTAAWLTSRELTEAAGPWDTRLLVDDDGEYFCRVLLASDRVRFVPEARVYYRRSGCSSLSYIGRSDQKAEAHWRSMQLHVGYLRSLEESQDVRDACVKYLQSSLIHFHPERADIVQQAAEMANELGGRLEVPQLSWKYSWTRAIFGWNSAKWAGLFLPRIRWSVERSWDRTLFHIENRKLVEDLGNGEWRTCPEDSGRKN
jgi:glycosyltransferase involved in cell wall biosynthesis